MESRFTKQIEMDGLLWMNISVLIEQILFQGKPFFFFLLLRGIELAGSLGNPSGGRLTDIYRGVVFLCMPE